MRQFRPAAQITRESMRTVGTQGWPAFISPEELRLVSSSLSESDLFASDLFATSLSAPVLFALSLAHPTLARTANINLHIHNNSALIRQSRILAFRKQFTTKLIRFRWSNRLLHCRRN